LPALSILYFRLRRVWVFHPASLGREPRAISAVLVWPTKFVALLAIFAAQVWPL